MTPKSAAEIIDAYGGSTVFAKAVGWSAGAVRLWKHRNLIPRDAWPEVIKAFPDITLDLLMEIEPDSAPRTYRLPAQVRRAPRPARAGP
jgi:hypothetical protein